MEQKIIPEKEEVGIALEIPPKEEDLIVEKKQESSPIENWVPKTQVGKDVKSGRIKNISEIILSGRKILEPEIVDSLIVLEKDLLLV